MLSAGAGRLSWAGSRWRSLTESHSDTREAEARRVQRTEASSTRGSCEARLVSGEEVRCYHAELLLGVVRLPGAGEADVLAAEAARLVLATHAVLHPVTQPGKEVTRFMLRDAGGAQTWGCPWPGTRRRSRGCWRPWCRGCGTRPPSRPPTSAGTRTPRSCAVKGGD